MAGDCVLSSEYYRQAIALFRSLDNRRSLASSLTTFGSRIKLFSYAAVFTTDELLKGAREGLQEVDQAIHYAREVGWRAGEAHALISQSGVLVSLGHYAQALDNAQTGLALAEAIGHRQWMTVAHFFLGILYLDMLAFPQSQQHFEMAHDSASAIGSKIWMHFTASYLALVYLAQQRMDRAQALLDTVLPPDAPAESLAQRTAWYVRAEMALMTGDPMRALAFADMLEAPTHPTHTPAEPSRVVVYALRLRGEGLVALHRYREAEVILKSACDLWQELGLRPMLWRTLVLLSQAYAGQERHMEARQAVSAACDILQTLAADAPEELRDHLLHHAASLHPPA
jgi:tetratricopeptide (TPR) repeat protein